MRTTARNALSIVMGWTLAIGCQPSGQSAPPMVTTQAPGNYRMVLGDFEITALNDGVVAYQTAEVLPGATAEQIERGLAAMGLSDPVGMSYNAFLVDTGDKLVLIDTGTGGKLDDSPYFRGAGRLLANLRAAGFQPEQVDEIYITHLGPDHVGGLTNGTERVFPNAVLRAARQEVDVFLDPEQVRARPDDWRIPFWTDLFEPYIQAGKFESFDDDRTLVPGIRALATHGHTPGHTSYVVESQGQTLIVLGDLVLVGAVQFADPSLSSPFDADRPASAVQRERIFRLAADNDYWVAGAHLSFPGIGHVRSDQERFSWIPAHSTIPQ